jgi:hypothetical protein
MLIATAGHRIRTSTPRLPAIMILSSQAAHRSAAADRDHAVFASERGSPACG